MAWTAFSEEPAKLLFKLITNAYKTGWMETRMTRIDLYRVPFVVLSALNLSGFLDATHCYRGSKGWLLSKAERKASVAMKDKETPFSRETHPSNDLFTHLKSIQAGTTTHPHWVLATCHILFSDPQPTSITLSWVVHGSVVFIWLGLTMPLWSGRDKMQK